jgi:thioredoxin reductase (NADPH)
MITYDVIIVGSGPAGHTAAMYLARANLKLLMLEGENPGGLLTTTKTVENFPGFPDGIDGYELTDRFKKQSQKFGTEIISEQVNVITHTKTKNKIFKVKTSSDTIYKSKSVIISTGSTPKRLDIPGYDEYWHKGVSTCAVCDGGLPAFRNVPIAVVGGGDSACEEALHLTHTASQVYLIHRRDTLRASKIMVDRVLKNPKIKMIWNTEVLEILGNKDQVNEIKLINNKEKKQSKLKVKGIFVAIGHTPNSLFISSLVDLDENGYIKTNEKKETSLKGIWAAGDVQDPHYRQAITAAGAGCVAALEVERYLNQL